MASRFVANPAQIYHFLHAPDQPVNRMVKKFGAEVEKIAKQSAPVDTGELRRTTNASPVKVGPSDLRLEVGSPLFYSIIVHQGRGPIRPLRAPALVFRWKRAGNRIVKFQYVKPRKGRPYLWDALVSANHLQPPGQTFTLVRGAQPRREGS